MSTNNNDDACILKQHRIVKESANFATKQLTISFRNVLATSKNEKADDGEKTYSTQNPFLSKLLNKSLVTSSYEIEVLRSDKDHPLHSVKSFEQLHLKKEILEAIYLSGFNSPSRIQEATCPAILASPSRNLIAQSQNGTGKTFAFCLSMLNKVDYSSSQPQVLILSPTYELGEQLISVINQLSKFLPEISVAKALRSSSLSKGAKISSQIIVGTPGTTLSWIRLKIFDPSLIKIFILDEADVMIDIQGHKDKSVRILRHINTSQCQLLFFSATYSEEVMEFSRTLVPNPLILRVKKENLTLKNIKQFYQVCTSFEHKIQCLINIFGALTMGQCIVFVKTKKDAADLAEILEKELFAVSVLTSDFDVFERNSKIENFKSGTQRILIATNVLSRGIDVEQVTVVINFHIPLRYNSEDPDFETYLHRIGRTGRFGRKGLSFNLILCEQIPLLLKIQSYFAIKIDQIDLSNASQLETLEF